MKYPAVGSLGSELSIYSEVGPLVGEGVGEVRVAIASTGEAVGSGVTGEAVGGSDTGEALGLFVGSAVSILLVGADVGSAVSILSVGADVGSAVSILSVGADVGSVVSILLVGARVGSPEGSAVVGSSVTAVREGSIVLEPTVGAGVTAGVSSTVSPLRTTGSESVSGSPLPISVGVEANGS